MISRLRLEKNGKSEIFYSYHEISRFFFHFDLAGFSSLVAGILSIGPVHIHKHREHFNEAFISDKPRTWLTLQFILERELSL